MAVGSSGTDETVLTWPSTRNGRPGPSGITLSCPQQLLIAWLMGVSGEFKSRGLILFNLKSDWSTPTKGLFELRFIGQFRIVISLVELPSLANGRAIRTGSKWDGLREDKGSCAYERHRL